MSFSYASTISFNAAGQEVSGAGDFNSDGYGDVLIGAESETSSTGAVYIAYSTPNPVNTTISSLPRLGGAAAI